MSPIYNLIQSIIQTMILAMLREGYLDLSVYSAQILVDTLTYFVYLLVVSIFGLYLWNHGLVAAITVLRPIGTDQIVPFRNKYIQWLVTLLALSFIL